MLPGVFFASALTRAVNGVCISSITNTTEIDQTIQLTCVDLENLELSEGALTLTYTAAAGSDCRL